MKNKNIYILGVVLVILAVVSYFVMRDTSGEKKTLKVSEKLFALDTLNIDKFEIEKNGQKIVIQKKGGLWNVVEPVVYAANQQFINGAITTLKEYKLSSIVSENPGNKDIYGFNDTNYTKVAVYHNGNLAGTFLIGKAAPGPSQTYLKKPDANDVYLAGGFLFNNFVKEDFSKWRDLAVISIPVTSIESIDFETGSEKYTAVKDTLNKFFIGVDSVSTEVFDNVLSMLSNFNTQDFKDTVISDNEKASYLVRVNGPKPTEFRFIKYGNDDANKFLLQVSGIKQIYLVDQNFVKNFIKPRNDLLGKK